MSSTNIPNQRTQEKTVKEMLLAAEECNKKKTNINGVKGPSFLMLLEYFDLIKNMIPDSMHK